MTGQHAYPPERVDPDVPSGAGLVPLRSDALPPSAGYAASVATSTATEEPAPPSEASPEEWRSPRPDRGRRHAADAQPSESYSAVATMPRPEDLLLPDRPAVDAAPARWGWRGRLHRLTFGLYRGPASGAELAQRQAVDDIQRGFSRPMTVVVIQPKGGAGKTPTTIGLASALGSLRGGYVVGWDDNETRGTLAVRVANADGQRTTAWDLLGELPAFERAEARVGDLGYFVRAQGEAQFDALVSDDNPANMAQIGEDEFRRIHAVLQRFYRLIVIDTGNNVRSPNWQAAVNAADVVVVVSTYQRDVGYSGSWVLDHLMQTGREDLARNAVTVLTAADPTIDATVRGELISHFTARTQAVVEVPFDPVIASGGPMRWTQLSEASRQAWVRAGATVVMALAATDQRRR